MALGDLVPVWRLVKYCSSVRRIVPGLIPVC
jgi:hypothetical protein